MLQSFCLVVKKTDEFPYPCLLHHSLLTKGGAVGSTVCLTHSSEAHYQITFSVNCISMTGRLSWSVYNDGRVCAEGCCVSLRSPCWIEPPFVPLHFLERHWLSPRKCLALCIQQLPFAIIYYVDMADDARLCSWGITFTYDLAQRNWENAGLVESFIS